MIRRVGPAALEAMLLDEGELALLDIREEGSHAGGHLLFASSLPLSRLELRVADMLPRVGVRIVLCDGDGGALAARAARRLAELGYTDLAILEGGCAGWAAAGRELFSGVHVPSKAFGELVEHHYGTPRITARELHARQAAGADLVVLDSRPMAEFRVMSIPGGIDCPGAELVYRAHDLAPSPATLVVVNCAGRTRSIIGAQSLINAGIPNPVVALENGTMGWHLAGLELARGESRRYGALSDDGLAKARAAAARIRARFGVPVMDMAGLDAWRAEADERSLYTIDVREAAEFEAGHLAGSFHVPGGQLVQETEATVGALRSRIALIDDTGVRAAMTASWLIQMGWPEVAVVEGALESGPLETGPRQAPIPGLDAAETALVTARDFEAGGAVVVDVGSSRAYRAGHIPGAWFAVRARLAAALAKLPAAERLVFTSDDGVLARFAAAEAAALTSRPVAALDGGTAAWRAAGLALAQGPENMATEDDDAWLKPYDHEAGQEQRMRDYLAWETALVPAVKRDGCARFRLFPEAAGGE